MKLSVFRFIIFYFIVLLAASCANIVPPEGGKKDTRPPKLLSITPADSQVNNRVTKIELRFNEFIELNNASAEIQISPLLPFAPTVVAVGKKVTIKIPDSLLQTNTTYRISTNNAIKDLHEGNPAKAYTYTFSTGGYFDSLELTGIVYNAATGLPDTGTYILLYPATKSDSVVVKEKPMYVTKVTDGGFFALKGLPAKQFRIYALHDANGNLVYDGKGEMIGFIDSIVTPVQTSDAPIVLKSFAEVIADSFDAKPSTRKPNMQGKKDKDNVKEVVLYNAGIDTSNINKRSFDVTKPLKITFPKYPDTIYKQRIFISYDSMDIVVEVPFTIRRDTAAKENMLIDAVWKDDMIYTLRFLKAFAKDSFNNEALPSKYVFRTKNDDDYGIIDIRLPLKYKDSKYMLMVNNEADTIYNKPVTDTVVKLKKIMPGTYSMRIIIDKNKNGKWDTGDLFEKRQPEEVIPYNNTMVLKAGWESVVDFEKKPKPKMDTSPKKRDKPPAK